MLTASKSKWRKNNNKKSAKKTEFKSVKNKWKDNEAQKCRNSIKLAVNLEKQIDKWEETEILDFCEFAHTVNDSFQE